VDAGEEGKIGTRGLVALMGEGKSVRSFLISSF